MRLKGKTAIVTGGASGFGEGIARRFADEGAAVVIADIDEARAVTVADAIAGRSGKAHAAVCDVTVSGDIAHLVDETLSSFGAVDIVVNNAGMPQVNGPMLDVDEETFDRIFAVNVKSIYLMTRHILPVMRQIGGGAIINTASTAALRPRPGLAWYNASKGAVVTLTKSMAVELAPERIRVNALCPVAGATPMLAAFMGGAVTNEMQQKFIATIPMGRLSTPRDMANAALYLASDEADFITGVCLEVDGGRCI